jgi:hypothetical protein
MEKKIPTLSEPMEAQVSVHILQAVVPVEDQVALLDRPQPGHTEVDHSLEVPIHDGVNQ